MNKLLLALFLTLTPTAFASIWYVDGVNGNDNNDCKTRQTACKTIGHAISLASAGDTIGVGPATYTENLTIAIRLNVIGSGATTTIIDPKSNRTIVTISRRAHVSLSRVTVQNGFAYSAGGIHNAGTLAISSSSISGNSAASSGGGIYNVGTLTINNSAITGNTVTSARKTIPVYGGGIYNTGTLAIINSTIAGNLSKGIGTSYGGGIYDLNGTVTINNVTLSGNAAATLGGGIYYFDGTVTLQNSILANSGGNCDGTVTSAGYNMSSDGTCGLNGPGDLNNTDPKLGPLQNNGGPTQTQALLDGSPAIDAGNPNGCTDGNGHLLRTDQRGRPRPDKEDAGGCDMGAYERQSD